MYSIQEMVQRTETQRKEIEQSMDARGSYHPDDASIYYGQKRSVRLELQRSIRSIPLQEFLLKGLAGATYLIPDKLADVLYQAAMPFDYAPVISASVVTGWTGHSLLVDIVDQYSLTPGRFSDGAAGTRTPTTYQATLSPVAFSVPLIAETSMLEDSQYALAETYVGMAARAMAQYSNDLLLTVLTTAADGVGTLNSGNASADETTYAQVLIAVAANGDDESVSDTLIITPESWRHSVGVATTAIPGAMSRRPIPEPFHMRIQNLDTIFSTSPVLHDAADARGAAMTACKTLVFDRDVAILTGRKRWLQVDNYAHPVADLQGAVVSARQDTVSLQDDAIYVLTET